MKYLFILLLAAPLLLNAQGDTGHYYKYKYFKIEKEIPEDNTVDKDVLDYLGINRMDDIYFELLTDDKEAVFYAEDRISNSQEKGLDFADIMIQTYGNYYYNWSDSIIYNNKDSGGRKYSVKYGFDYYDWKFHEETEEINGYSCKKATYTKEEEHEGEKRDYIITIWYTDEISSEAMPFGFAGLPGGIVKIIFNGGWEAILIESLPKTKRQNIKAPKLGEIVTPEEYTRITDENFKKRRESRRGSGVDKD